MKMILEYQGKTYETMETDEKTAEGVAEVFYKNFDGMDRLKMNLADGSFLVIGKAALQSAVLRFLP
jgi:hypothetical protein